MKISNIYKCIFFSIIFIINIICCNNVLALDINAIEQVDNINVLNYEKESSSFNMSNINSIATKSLLAGKASILDKYDLRNDVTTIRVKDQGSSKSCWTFSTLSVLETNLQKTKGEYLDFSERHMNYATSKTFLNGEINPWGYEREIDDGGNPMIALSYITRGSGPVLESDMEFTEDESQIDISEIENKNVVKKINNYVVFPSIYKYKMDDGSINYTDGMENGTVYTQEEVLETRNKIKEHIVQYGGVTAMTVSGSVYEEYYNYNMEYPPFYSDNNLFEANHQVTIIGWDDNYPVSNFSPYHRPKNPGAYLVLNSYGTDGNYKTGYYYISYEDFMVEACVVGIVDTSDIDYDNIYQHDPLGVASNVKIGGQNELYGANVFERDISKTNEKIKEISIASQVDINCELYINSANGNLNSNELVKINNGMISLKAGYNTIKLDKPIELVGDKFAVAVRYISNDNDALVGIEAPSTSKYWDTAKSNEGESYLGNDLDNWVDLSKTNVKNANICIKVFTQEIDNDIISDVYDIDENMISNISPYTYIQLFEVSVQTNAQMKILDKNNNQISQSDYIATDMKLVLNDDIVYNLSVKGDLNGDGQISATDLSKIKMHLISLRLLDGAYLKSANLDGDNEITITDLSKIRKAYFGEINL